MLRRYLKYETVGKIIYCIISQTAKGGIKLELGEGN